MSTSVLHAMASVSNALSTPRIPSAYHDDNDGDMMSTLPDPRSRARSPMHDDFSSSSDQPLDELATLSNKLINAINHQTNLDETLSRYKHELDTSRQRIRQLELENEEYNNKLACGALVERSIVDVEKNKLKAELAVEQKLRKAAQVGRKAMESELESLSTALFEEANKMVVAVKEEAQKEQEVIQRRNDQLKAQVADTESLLRSQQEQLAELKTVMEQLADESHEGTTHTAPSTPGFSKFDDYDTEDPLHSSGIMPLTPSQPTSFTHLLQTVLRTDLSAFDDFVSLLRLSKTPATGNRVSSGSYGTIGGLTLGLGGYTGTQASSNGSSSTLSSAPATPTTPASSVSGSSNGANFISLKETKFYKRAVAEDIEPTLRLDSAPGLSWLARRTVLSSVIEGTMVVEPSSPSSKQTGFPCSMCGELRMDEAHQRTHRFRTNESDNSQKYPLCRYCLGRVRSTCDFMGFLRVVKEGHWRADDEEAERSAWEESVRLRENMFWSRIGGGVVPTQRGSMDASRSPRSSEDEKERIESERRLSAIVDDTGEIRPKDVTPSPRPLLKVIPATDGVEEDVIAGLKDTELSEDAGYSTPEEDINISSAELTDGVSPKGTLKATNRLSITIPFSAE